MRDNDMVYVLDGETYSTPIKNIRGDCRLLDEARGEFHRRKLDANSFRQPDRDGTEATDG
jgi:hypothetical protein